MIDAHCHLDFASFDADRAEQIEAAHAVGVRGFVVAGVDPEGWERQAALQARHPEARAAYGLHPWTVASWDRAQLSSGLELLSGRLAFAVGETGLDRSRHCDPASLPLQEEAFRAQLSLARARDLPVILHILQAHGRALEILKEEGLPRAGGMVHSYSGAPDLVADYESLGLYISFSGSVTWARARKTQEAAARVDTARLLVETDCPDQSPEGYKGDRNMPRLLPLVVEKLAEIRRQRPADVIDATQSNAQRLFGTVEEWS